MLELVALELLEPPAADRIDAGFAQLMALVYNRTRGKSEAGKQPADFLPRWGPTDHVAIENRLRAGIEMMRGMKYGA